MDATVTVEYYKHQVSSTPLLKAKWTFHHLLSFQMKRTNHPSLCISSVMKRFSCRNTSCLTNPRRMFNKSLSTARKSVECAFGILVSKFRVFEGPFSCSPNKVDDITKAACVLHNYIRRHDGVPSTPRTDQELTNAYNLFPQPPRQIHGRTVTTAQQLRDRLCEHFLDPRNAIESQFSVCV